MSETLQVMRPVKVYNTLGQNLREINTGAMNLGEFKRDLSLHGIPYSGMSIIIGETQQQLITDNSSLLPGSQTIFLMPTDVKSGLWNGEENEEDDDDIVFEDDEDEEEQEESEDDKILIQHHLRNAIQHLQYMLEILERQPETSDDPVIQEFNRKAAEIQRGMTDSVFL